MSAEVIVRINCDRCKNAGIQVSSDCTADSTKPNLHTTRVYAKAHGWTSVRHNHGVIEDRCPKCSPKKEAL